MMQLDSAPAADISPATEELAMELKQDKVDRHLIEWLIQDREANVGIALALAHLKEQDLLKRPSLRPLGLQKYLRGESNVRLRDSD